MHTFYSASRNAFFDDRLHRELPEDAVAISDEMHLEMLAAQAQGRPFRPGANGLPVAKAPKRSVADLRGRAIAKVKAEAEWRIGQAAPVWRQINAMRSDIGAADPLFATIDAIRAASNRIEAAIATMTTRQLADFDVAGDARWPS